MSELKKEVNTMLSPPWVQYYNQVKYSVGADADISVGALLNESEGVYFVVLTVSGNLKAAALANLLIDVKEIGNIIVKVLVRNTEGEHFLPVEPTGLSPFEIAQFFIDGLKGNACFDDAVMVQEFLHPGELAVYPLFIPCVIQFWNNNLADLYQNENHVATYVFRNVLRGNLNNTRIIFSTSVVK